MFRCHQMCFIRRNLSWSFILWHSKIQWVRWEKKLIRDSLLTWKWWWMMEKMILCPQEKGITSDRLSVLVQSFGSTSRHTSERGSDVNAHASQEVASDFCLNLRVTWWWREAPHDEAFVFVRPESGESKCLYLLWSLLIKCHQNFESAEMKILRKTPSMTHSVMKWDVNSGGVTLMF